VESAPAVGGKVVSYCCKATTECSRCGVCVAHTNISKALRHDKVSVYTGAAIETCGNNGKNVTCNVTIRNPRIDYHTCIECDACIDACPAQCITKYHRAELTQYIVDHDACLLSRGKKCNKCAAACPVSAIHTGGATSRKKLSAEAAVVATGHDPYDATGKPRFSYGRFDQVLNGEEAEKLLSSQDYLRKPGESVAFIQCVGSRDPQIKRNYCSSVCCAYALRMARVLKHRNPESDVTIYYIDIQNFDKAFTDLRNKLAAEGVKFIRGIPFTIEQDGNGKLKLKIEDPRGGEKTVEHDTVVLSVGMGPGKGAAALAEKMKLEQDEFGFFKSDQPNVFVTGTCAAPQSITESMAKARAVAADMV